MQVWLVRIVIWMRVQYWICRLRRRIASPVISLTMNMMEDLVRTALNVIQPKAGNPPNLITIWLTSNWWGSIQRLPARSVILMGLIEVRQKIATPVIQLKMNTMENMARVVNSVIPQLIGMMRILTIICSHSNWKAAMPKSSASPVI